MIKQKEEYFCVILTVVFSYRYISIRTRMQLELMGLCCTPKISVPVSQPVHMTKEQNTTVWPVFPIIKDTNQAVKFTVSLTLGGGQSWLTARGKNHDSSIRT